MCPTHVLPFYLILQISSVLALAEINTSPHIAELWLTVLVGVLLGLSPTVQETDISNLLTQSFPTYHSPKPQSNILLAFFFLLAFD